MLSAFPNFLSYGQLSPLLIRLVLGAIFIFWAYEALRDTNARSEKKAVGLLKGVVGILLVIGLWTQIAALVALVDLIVRLIGKMQKRLFLTDGVNYYLILLVMAVSLIVTGAGWFAFDLPL